MSDLRLRIEGADADDVGQALEDFFQSEFGHRPRREWYRPAAARDERADPVALATLFLTIPPALVATLDLAGRMRLKSKVERLLAVVRDKTAASKTSVVLEDASGKPLPLDRATAAEVIDSARWTGGRSDAS